MSHPRRSHRRTKQEMPTKKLGVRKKSAIVKTIYEDHFIETCAFCHKPHFGTRISLDNHEINCAKKKHATIVMKGGR